MLDDVSFTFQKGKTNLIIGKSGSGKSVLTKCIVGLLEPDAGEIIFDGRSFRGIQNKERKKIRKELGMLFQGGALFDSLSVEDNVAFPLRMFSDFTNEEIIERTNFCLNRVNIINKNNLFPAEISGGMQKRVAIARAIAMNPKYLFCDEPNSGLDPKTAIVIDKLIHEITKEYNITTIINSHDMNSVIEIGEKIVFLVTGEKNWEGTNTEILKTNVESVKNFVYSSELLKKVKKYL